MTMTKSARMQDHLAELTDTRRREVTYPLINIVVIAGRGTTILLEADRLSLGGHTASGCHTW